MTVLLAMLGLLRSPYRQHRSMLPNERACDHVLRDAIGSEQEAFEAALLEIETRLMMRGTHRTGGYDHG